MRHFTLHFAAFILLCLAPTVQAQDQIASGTVFLDANGNGRLDSGEQGLPRVKVSNGLDVVTTDEAGRYEIPVTDDSIVFVIKPRDYMTAIDELNMPRFYYIHKPQGSPDDNFIFPGVEPTGELPESIDFPLTRSPEPAEFDVIVMGDPQPSNERQVRFYANDTLAELVDSDAALMIVMGDLVGDDLDLFDAVNQVQAKVGVPVYNVYGNHDMNFRAEEDRYADETFERVYGPTDYAFQYGSVHFVILDNVYWKGYIGNRDDGFPITNNYEGRLTDAQLQFVTNFVGRVPADERIVICTHIPMVSPDAVQHSVPQYGRLLQILSGHAHTQSFSAHTHLQAHYFAGSSEGYTPPGGGEHHHHNVATASGSWYRGPLDEQGLPITTMMDGGPNGYNIVTFSGTDYRTRFKASRRPADYQLAIHVPSLIPREPTRPVEMAVNVFNGSEKSKVRYRIEGGEWRPMHRAPAIDPAYAAFQARDAARPTPGQGVLPAPRATSHIWITRLPQLPTGVHAVEVEATDMFGVRDHGQRLLEVE